MAAANKKEKVIVKKVSPYPIDVQIFSGPQPRFGQIIKLTTQGAIILTPKLEFKIKENYKINFTLPVFKKSLQMNVLVVKTYDRVVPPAAVPGIAGKYVVEYLSEMHFVNLDNVSLDVIVNFLKAIRQIE